MKSISLNTVKYTRITQVSQSWMIFRTRCAIAHIVQRLPLLHIVFLSPPHRKKFHGIPRRSIHNTYNMKCFMKLPKNEFIIYHSPWWTLLKMWDHTKSKFPKIELIIHNSTWWKFLKMSCQIKFKSLKKWTHSLW